MSNQVKLVIFDLDGTLADTIPDIAAAISKTIAKYGDFGNIEDLTRRSIGNGARKLMERVYDGLGISKAELDSDLKAYEALYARENCIDTVLYPHTMQVLEGLKARGIKMAVATMKPRGATWGVLENLGVVPFMEHIFSADDMAAPKPDPWSVVESARRVGVLPEECMMVGDSMTDVGSGINAGAVSVAVMGGYYDQEKMRHSGAMYSICDIGEVLTIVDEINSRA
jgi:phosphoglycolate phosphatase